MDTKNLLDLKIGFLEYNSVLTTCFFSCYVVTVLMANEKNLLASGLMAT